MTGTPDTGNRDRTTTAGQDGPTLEPDERRWLEGYLERLKNARRGAPQAPRSVRLEGPGNAGPRSDIGVPGLVADAPDAVEDGRELNHRDDDPGGVDHEIVVRRCPTPPRTEKHTNSGRIQKHTNSGQTAIIRVDAQ